MVDIDARTQAATLLERFLRQEITNNDLESGWPESRDVALEEIRLAVWLTYDDLYAHYGPEAPEELLQLLHRCVRFLKTTEEYAWPAPKRWQRVLAIPVSLLTLGWFGRWLWRADDPNWPFASVDSSRGA